MFSRQNLLLLTFVVLTAQFALAEESADELNAIHKIEMLGGKFGRAHYALGRPVVGVSFNDYSRFNEKYLHLLKSCSKLTTVEFTGPVITDEGMKTIGELKGLESLSLGNTKVTDAGLKELAGLDHLVSLQIQSDKITDQGLMQISRIRFLKHLTLRIPQMSDAGMRAVCQLKFLKHLNVSHVSITDAGLSEIAEMKCLNDLNLPGFPITDVGIKNISASQSLAELRIPNAKITDRGLKELGNLKMLHTLEIRKPGFADDFTEQGLEQLERELPDLKIARLAASNALFDGGAGVGLVGVVPAPDVQVGIIGVP